MNWALAVIALIVLAYAVWVRRLGAVNVSAAMFFTTAGLVAGPVLGVLDLHLRSEAIKLLAGIGETLAGRLMLFDALASRWHEVRLARDPHCRVCGDARVAA